MPIGVPIRYSQKGINQAFNMTEILGIIRSAVGKFLEQCCQC